MMKRLSSTRSATKMPLLWVASLALVSLQTLAAGESCEAHSATGRVAVLELYTSEGCNSCPPADRWVSLLPARGFTADRLILLAFHVDYWDELGWPDRMAKAQFSARQRMQAERNHASIVYTPQLLLNGADYRAWLSDTRLDEHIRELNRLPAGAELRLWQQSVNVGVEVELDVRLVQPLAAASAQTYVAITENRLQNAIQAGENQGKLLRHDFVVRDLAGPLPMSQNGRLRWRSTLALHSDWKRTDLSLVAFVQNGRSGDILQALQAPLCARP